MRVQCLHAQSGETEYAIPLPAIDHMGDFIVGPPPPSSRHGVLGVVEERGRLYLVMTPSERVLGEGAEGLMKCLVMRDSGRGYRWALCVDEVGRFSAVERSKETTDEDSWFGTGVDVDGQEVSVLDPDAIEQWLEGQPVFE